VLHRAEGVRQQVALARAKVLADVELARHRVESVVAAERGVAVSRRHGGWTIEVATPTDVRHQFVVEELPGAGPIALGRAASVREPSASTLVTAPALLAPGEEPRLDAAALAGAARPELCEGLQRDSGVALLHRAVGTDRDDFVLAAGRSSVTLDVVDQVLAVPGHLWIPAGTAPLVVELPRDLTVVVFGNLYLGRSVRLSGPGRLTVVTAVPEDAVAFADLDGNGQLGAADRVLGADRFRGPVEGAGSVYLGLRHGGRCIDFAGALVVAGQLHLAADARVAGPLVLQHGVSTVGDRSLRLHAAGDWCFLPERERIPGFMTSGPPRAGRLVLQPVQNRAMMDQQPLYLPTPGR